MVSAQKWTRLSSFWPAENLKIVYSHSKLSRGPPSRYLKPVLYGRTAVRTGISWIAQDVKWPVTPGHRIARNDDRLESGDRVFTLLE